MVLNDHMATAGMIRRSQVFGLHVGYRGRGGLKCWQLSRLDCAENFGEYAWGEAAFVTDGNSEINEVASCAWYDERRRHEK